MRGILLNRRYLIALFILLCLLVASFSAEAFFVMHRHHDCPEHDCQVCDNFHKIETMDAFMNKVKASIVIILVVMTSFFATILAIEFTIVTAIKSVTPVGIKVRINN